MTSTSVRLFKIVIKILNQIKIYEIAYIKNTVDLKTSTFLELVKRINLIVFVADFKTDVYYFAVSF